jgi:hypothetical protein
VTGQALAAGSRSAFFCVGRVTATGSRFLNIARVASGGNQVVLMGRGSVANQWQLRSTFQTAGQVTVFPTTPAVDTNWHLHSHIYRSTGCDYKIDNVAITAPGFTATTEAAGVMERFSIGHDAGSSAGDVALFLGLQDVPTARQEAEIRLYVKRMYGL